MSADFVADAVVNLLILCGFLMVLGIGCLIADFVVPHIPFIQRWLDSLPDWDDEE